MVIFPCSLGSYFMAFVQPQELKKEKVKKEKSESTDKED